MREVGAIQQLILMALSENEVVVQQACKTLGAYLTDTLSTLVSSRFHSLLRQACCLDMFSEDLLSPCLSLLCGVHSTLPHALK